MKILWFSNTPVNAYIDTNALKSSGGWLCSLESILNESNKVTLGIVFLSKDKEYREIKKNNTIYFPVYNKKLSKFGIIKNSLFYKEKLNNNQKEKILKIIEEFKPDLIHIHGTESCLVDSVNLIKNIPIVISLQGIVSSIYYQTKYIFKNFPIKLRNIDLLPLYLINYSLTKKRFLYAKARETDVLKKINYFIGRTEYDRTISSFLSGKSTYYVINRILRYPFYNQKWSSPDKKQFIIYTTMSGGFLKGFDTVVEAAFLLKEKGTPFEWRIGGLSRKDLIVKLLKKNYGKKYLHENIKPLGRLTADEIVCEMKRANIYVMTSHIENSPNNLSEAMILGMPCIAANAGGTSSLITNDLDGVLYQDSDPMALAGIIHDSYQNYNKYIKYGENSRKTALSRHDKENIINNLLTIYQKVTNK